jgi:hypothetical protein
MVVWCKVERARPGACVTTARMPGCRSAGETGTDNGGRRLYPALGVVNERERAHMPRPTLLASII